MRRSGSLMALALLVAACSGSDQLVIEDVWARTSANMQNAGAIYMTISGGSVADRLIGVSVDPSVARMAEVHQTTMTESDDGSEMMMMEPTDAIEIPAAEEILLEPGGYHVMLMGLAEPLASGERFQITLVFEDAGSLEVMVEVRDG